jgi:hypothetical protein
MPEGASEGFVESTPDNALSVEDVPVVRDMRIPQTLGAMLFFNPRSKWDVQRQRGACFGGPHASLRASRHSDHDFSNFPFLVHSILSFFSFSV